MNDAGKIVGGLIVFIAVVTLPMWFHMAKGTVPIPPEPKIETDAKNCVAPVEYMRTLHMDMLNEWRDDVVRRGDRIYTSPDGKQYDKSLSRTCMSCHHNKAEFCDACHDYAAVKPYCWDCHVEPTETQ
jgi:hypothetical protein